MILKEREALVMKQLRLQITLIWLVLLSISHTKGKHLRPRHKVDLVYPYRTNAYFRFLTERTRYGSEKRAAVYNEVPERIKRGSNRSENNKTFRRKISHGSTALPQPAKPLRVVATSAVIKNRLKKPRPLKAIHIWGPTPFKTVLQNLQKINDNLQKQRGSVKRLFLPVQLQRMQFLNALRKKPPFPGPIGPFPHRIAPFNLDGKFPVPSDAVHSPDAIHLDEGDPPPPVMPDPIGPIPPPLPVPPQPVAPFHDMGPMHFQEINPIHNFLPDHEVAPIHEIVPEHDLGPETAIPDIGPAPQMVSNNFGLPDIPPNLAPNFEPPHGLFEPPFPFLAGEIHEEVNRHVHKGVSKAKCSPNPCRNDGICTAFEKHYECECPIGFMGKDCEEVNHCLPNPCKNEGNCYATTNGYHCTCVKGFKGPNCDISSKCIPSPCRNGGTCEEDGSSYKCICLPGFEGSNCEAADHCAIGNPCKNGGTCLNGEKTFECHCLPGFYGVDCGDLDVCYSSPCQNSGTCHNTGAGKFMCLCPPLFRGVTCEERISKCESQPCQNEGTCVEDEEDGFHCTCSSKYQGKYCEEFRSACYKNPCMNAGKCVTAGDTFNCICTDGFTGSTCEVKMALPLLCTDCHDHAKCIDGKCVCEEGYDGNGNVCEVVKVMEFNLSTPLSLTSSSNTVTVTPLSVCHPNPCYNGGSCHENNSGFVCICPETYKGALCKDVSPCLGNPCENGGTCIEGVAPGDFICRCKEGYSGETCEEASACEPNPCKNGGTCHLEHKSYVCQCTDRFEGSTCEEDKCAKCDVHAHCENGKCVCDGGYYGAGIRGECFRVGASNPRFCVPNPCKHGGSCFEEPNGHRCLCASDYDGENCELSVGAAPPSQRTPDPCAGAPCKNGGSCVPKGKKFQCLCAKGFQGPTCEETAKSYCHPNPCLHGGKCIDDKNGYACTCIGSYRGVNCEVDDCDQCDIHAICVQGACRCRVGYKGDGFECEKVKRCHHCSPNATCISNECVCKPGFIGNGKHCRLDNCQGCPPHSHCHRGICICIPGFTFNGHRCVAVSPKPTTSHCPAECGSASKCPLTCPSHCCKTPEHHMVDNCPDNCHLSCEPVCPDHCCEQIHYIVPLLTHPTCPFECHTSCHQSCPIHCCKAPKPSANACPSHCQTSCVPSCPSQCCTATYLPTMAPTRTSCSSICKTHCLPTCPKYCCNLKIIALSTCPDNCKGICGPSCPMHCCSSLQLPTQHPTSPQQSCPSTCKANCLPSCPSFCCKISPAPLISCPSTCLISCLPSCPQHCCGLPYLPRSSASPSDVCPSQCAYRCDSSCPSQCCPSKPEQPSMQITEDNAAVSQETNPATPSSLIKPCPTYCSSFCTPSCPSYCCKRNEISPYLAKSPEETVTPFGRSLTDHDDEYKEKMIHHISELLSSPLTKCQPSCFSDCSNTCPKTCCDVRKKKKMYVFKRKKKTRITRPQTNK